MAEEERYDGIFMNIVQQAAGIDNFFEALFGFMRRKTDFFSNADAGRNMISKHFDRELEVFSAQKQREEETKKQKAAKQERDRKADKPSPAPKTVSAPSPKVVELTDEEAAAVEAETEHKQEEAKEEPKSTESDAPAPEGNGGRTEHYVWTQTLSEISVNVFIPEETTAKQVRVTCTPTNLVVRAGSVDIVNGKLHKRIKPDELLWHIDHVEGRKAVSLTVEKLEGMNWWSCILEGDLEIDTKKIVPENSKLSDLDGEMRSTVEKMMVDQQRKAAGLPSTDDEQKQEMLKKFMKAHPEMDFSKAKFS